MQACHTCKPHAASDALFELHSDYWSGVTPPRHVAGVHLPLAASRCTHTLCDLVDAEWLRCPHIDESSVCARSCLCQERTEAARPAIDCSAGRQGAALHFGGRHSCIQSQLFAMEHPFTLRRYEKHARNATGAGGCSQAVEFLDSPTCGPRQTHAPGHGHAGAARGSGCRLPCACQHSQGALCFCA